MTPEIEAAAGRVADVIMFENWLRFYFISEEGDTLFIRLPEKAMEQIRQRSPYSNLAVMLNNEEIDHQRSLKAVCAFISGGFGGVTLPDTVLAAIFDSPKFQLDLQLFTHWLQSHEEKLDERFMEFTEWQQAFALWKDSPEAQQYSNVVQQYANAAKTGS
jgi:hypothetical protein